MKKQGFILLPKRLSTETYKERKDINELKKKGLLLESDYEYILFESLEERAKWLEGFEKYLWKIQKIQRK